MGLLRTLSHAALGVSSAAGAELPEPPKAAKPEQNKSSRRFSWSSKGSKEARPQGVRTNDETSAAGDGEAAAALGQLLRRAVGCDDKLRLLDLSKPSLGFATLPIAKQLASLGYANRPSPSTGPSPDPSPPASPNPSPSPSPPSPSPELILTLPRVLVKARAVQAVWLPGLGLTDAHAPALAALLREHRTLQALCLERNGLTEPGLLQIAAAASGHPSLTELRVEVRARVRVRVRIRVRVRVTVRVTSRITVTVTVRFKGPG